MDSRAQGGKLRINDGKTSEWVLVRKEVNDWKTSEWVHVRKEVNDGKTSEWVHEHCG